MWMRALAITAVLLLSTPAMAQITDGQLEQARRETEAAKLKLEKLKADIERDTQFANLKLEKLKADIETEQLIDRECPQNKQQRQGLPPRQPGEQITDVELGQARRDTEFAKLKLEKLKAYFETQKLERQQRLPPGDPRERTNECSQ
jgi:hypothetical protein